MFIIINKTRNGVEFLSERPNVHDYREFLDRGDDIIMLLNDNSIVWAVRFAEGEYEDYTALYTPSVWEWSDESVLAKMEEQRYQEEIAREEIETMRVELAAMERRALDDDWIEMMRNLETESF